MDQAIEQRIVLALLQAPNCLGGKTFENIKLSHQTERKFDPKLICLFDMGWNQCFLDSRYSSPSGRAFLIGAKIKKTS